MKAKVPFSKTLPSTAIILTVALGVVSFTAIVSRYCGLLQLGVGGINGGYLVIDGRCQPGPALSGR